MTTTQTPVDALMALVDRYWELAYAEGKEGRDHDTEAGEAQAVLSEIRASARALAATPEQQAGGVPAGWRKGMEVAASILESNAGPATRKAAADGLRNLLAASPSPSAVQPLSEAQIEDLHGEANRGFFIEKEDYFKAFRDAERAHGIVTEEST